MSTQSTSAGGKRPVEQVESVTIRFVGDSGDGMQLVGSEFTKASALAGNDLATFPDFPAEIRAPAGSLAGVSRATRSTSAARRSTRRVMPPTCWSP